MSEIVGNRAQAGRTLILSDLHMGRASAAIRSADSLRPLWQGFDHLILNGDTAEVHHPDHRANAARMALRLLALCEKDGVEVTVLSGNHDPMITDRRRVELCDGEVFITHGDVFHPAVAPWSPRADALREAYSRALEAMQAQGAEAPQGIEARLAASQHASRAEWNDLEHQAGRSTLAKMLLRPWAILQVVWYWYRFPRLAVRFADEHDVKARFLIFGHTHHQGIWRIDGRIVINTGSFNFPGRPWAVTVADGALHVLRIEKRRDGEAAVFELDRESAKVFEMAGDRVSG